MTIPYLVFPPRIYSVQLFECHPSGHNLHDILWFFEAKNLEWITLRTIFSYGLQHIYISNIFVSGNFSNGISRYTLGPLFALLDERSSVDTKLRRGCDPLWRTTSTVKHNKLTNWRDWITHLWYDPNSIPQILPFLWTKLSWPVLALHNMCSPQNGGESATNVMPLIAKWIPFTSDKQTSSIPLVGSIHHGIIKNIDPWWKKLVSHILVPSFLQLLHVEEAILVWHLSVGKTKSTENIIKPVARHYVIESKWITFSHRWCRRGPPVTMTLNYNPACHVYTTYNPLYKLLKIHCHTQTLVGLENKDLLKLFLWEHNKKQLKQWHMKDVIMQIMSERSEIILKVDSFPWGK